MIAGRIVVKYWHKNDSQSLGDPSTRLRNAMAQQASSG